MRKLDLERAFPCFGAPAENFQNEPGAIEHLGIPGLLEVALLDGRQRAIHHDKLDRMSADEAQYLLDFALAEISCRPNPGDRRDQGFRDSQIDGARKADRFVKPRLLIAQATVIR